MTRGRRRLLIGEPGGRRWSERGRLVVGAFLLFNLGGSVVMEEFSRFAIHAYRIASSSMEPTLHCARPVIDVSEREGTEYSSCASSLLDADPR